MNREPVGYLTCPPLPMPVYHALLDVIYEREQQAGKWGEQNHPDGTGGPGSHHLANWARAVCQAKDPDTYWKILLEEVFEAGAEDDPAKLRAELVQVAAVAVQWVEAIDRRADT